MTESTFNKLRQQLLHLKSECETRVGQNNESLKTVELDQNRMGRLTRMDALQGQQMAQEAERRLILKMKKIDGALLRLENDDYGYCYICDNEIQIARLQFDPTLTRCMACTESETSRNG